MPNVTNQIAIETLTTRGHVQPICFFTARAIKLSIYAYPNASTVVFRHTSSFIMYIRNIHKQDPNDKGLKHFIQGSAAMHPYSFRGQCIQDATMFIFKFNTNRIQKFSITFLTSQFVIKNSYKSYSKSSLKITKISQS